MEIGGYLPIELNTGEEYYNYDNNSLIRLNSARNAILLAIRDGGYSKVYIPLYLCPSVKDALKSRDICFEEYNISRNLLPDISLPIQKLETENACIILVNYYGILKRELIEQYIISHKYIIVDNTQGFFCDPFIDVYNVYSCRKFFGVSDGAYLIHKNLGSYNFEIDISYKRMAHLISSIEMGTNFSYQESLKCEEDINRSEILLMSKLTKKILQGIDYEKIKKKRNDNFNYLHTRLQKYNLLEIDEKNIDAPMVYPFLFVDETLREKLITQRIYIPQWWKICLDNPKSNDFEKTLSQYLFPLPIDQRYNTWNMAHIVDTIETVISNKKD